MNLRTAIAITSSMFFLFSSLLVGQENEIGFIEQFVLAEDREALLNELIPGTEAYYFYRALHYQNQERSEDFNEILDAWGKRYPQSEQRSLLKNRQALLDWESDPQGTIAYLVEHLNVRFDDRQDRPETNPDLPVALDQESITLEAFAERLLAGDDNVSRVTDRGLENLVRLGVGLTTAQKRDLLGRVQRPDFPDLVDLILDELADKESRGFGSLAIHSQLLLEQLDRLMERRNELTNNEAFVRTYCLRLVPNEDVDLRHDPDAQRDYYERLWGFVEDLPNAFNALKAHVLYHWLELEREQGNYPRERFLAYLQLPRAVWYVPREWLETVRLRSGSVVQLNEDFSGFTGRRPVHSDESLVRDYLLHFFVDAENTEPFDKYIEESWLQRIFAEAKIVNGVGDQEGWYAMLSPAEYQALLERVDIDFAPENDEEFQPHETVRLLVDVKNVKQLIVKIYEINTLNYYLNHQREISTDLDLDGLVPNEETTYEYDTPPLRRTRRDFSFPHLGGKRGVWMIEFIGNGVSSRALVRKGGLHYLSRTSVDGEVVFVQSEDHEVLKDATVWVGNRAFTSDENGAVLIPFSNEPGRKSIVLADTTGFASMDTLDIPAEEYALTAGFFVNREELVPGQEATMLIRPTLSVAGEPVTLSVLQDAKLFLVAEDLDGIQTTHDVQDFALTEGKETTHSVRVTDRLAKLTAVLSGKVRVHSTGEDAHLSAQQTFAIDQIDRTAQTSDFHLSRLGEDWRIEWLGKSGEPMANRAVLVEIRHKAFSEDFEILMRTDDDGRIHLGPLAEIVRVKAGAEGMEAKRWWLPAPAIHYPEQRHLAADETLRVPFAGVHADQRGFSLLEVREGQYVRDVISKASLDENGFLVIAELEPGDYELHFKDAGETIRIRVAEGENTPGLVMGDARLLTKRHEKPLQVSSVEARDGALAIQLGHANDFTRVHVSASRFLPAFDTFALLDQPIREPYVVELPHRPSLYHSGRRIGDEQRYILDRRQAPRFPGNMLTRPRLILDPWERKETDTEKEEAKAGQDLARLEPGEAARRRQMTRDQEEAAEEVTAFASLDFLPADRILLANLEPDANGLVEVPLEDLKGRPYLQVIAIDPENTVVYPHSLSEADVPFRRVELADALDPRHTYAERKAVSVLAAGETLSFQDASSSELEMYDTLDRIFRYFVTKSNDATLTQFEFVLRWPSLSAEEKRAKYSEFASHELNVFLARKDPSFFREVILPYVANKKDKQFIDHYLLGASLEFYLEPWRFEGLNAAERAFLGRRLGGEHGQMIARHLGELLELRPPPEETRDVNFATALAGLRLGRRPAMERFLAEGAPMRPPAPATRAADAKLAQLADQEPMDGATKDVTSQNLGAAIAGVAGNAFGVVEESLEQMPQLQAEFRENLGELKEAEVAAADDKAATFSEREKGVDRFYFARGRGVDELDRRGFYQELPATKEWAENNYHNRPLTEETADLVDINTFWRDYAEWNGEGEFLSIHFIEATQNVAEMMLALAVMDLPFEAEEHELTREDGKVHLKSGSSMIVFRRQLEEVEEADAETKLLVSQNFYRHGDRHRQEGGEQVDNFVTDEFLTQVVYGCEVIITNPTSTSQTVEVLTQIPAGSIPVLGSRETKSQRLVLSPYSTHKVEFAFYFPDAGEFAHYPVSISKDGKTVAQAEPFTFKVVNRPTVLDKETWEYVSQWASPEEVLAFLEKKNLQAIDLGRMAWRMHDEAFFQKTIALLEKRHAYDQRLWRYGLEHAAAPAIEQYLKHSDFLDRCGPWLESELVDIDPVARHGYQHLEYWPLVHARAHVLGGERKILNDALYRQYLELMAILQYKDRFDSEDHMTLTYYLFLQDRVQEALHHLGLVDPGDLETRLQYDYFQAYAAFYREEPSMARSIVQQYANHPVDKWKKLFAEVGDQLAEIEGKSSSDPEGSERHQRQDQLADTEPRFSFGVENGAIRLAYRNVEVVTINYYEMDVEFLFSSSPFVEEDGSRFSVIKPNVSERVQLDPSESERRIALPREVAGKNVLIEILGAGQRRSDAHFSHRLDLQLAENYGRLQVRHREDQRTLSEVYVKVYARFHDGRTAFYKDGYTDLRGKFDYASLTQGDIDRVERFSLLVMSDEHGAVIEEAAAPER